MRLQQKRPRAALLWALAPSWIWLSCLSMTPLSLEEAGEFELGPDQGIVLLFIESNSHFDSVEIRGGWGRTREIREIGTEGRMRAFVAPAGVYRWSRANASFPFGTYFDLAWDPAKPFEVRKGRVSYPGHLVLIRDGNQLFSRVLNRSSDVAELLVDTRPWLFERLPAVFTGYVRDDFLSDYQAAWRERVHVAPRSELLPDEVSQ